MAADRLPPQDGLPTQGAGGPRTSSVSLALRRDVDACPLWFGPSARRAARLPERDASSPAGWQRRTKRAIVVTLIAGRAHGVGAPTPLAV